ncbi:hypothetical protein GCM10020255_002400 [Rhodococcus baikonurensis]
MGEVGESVDDTACGVSVGGENSAIGRLEGLDQSEDLEACDFTDYEEVESLADELVENCAQTEAAGELSVCAAFTAAHDHFCIDDEVSTAWEFVEEEFSFGFGDSDSCLDGECVGQGAGECRFAVAHSAADSGRCSSSDGAPEHVCKFWGHHEVVE